MKEGERMTHYQTFVALTGFIGLIEVVLAAILCGIASFALPGKDNYAVVSYYGNPRMIALALLYTVAYFIGRGLCMVFWPKPKAVNIKGVQ